MLSLLSLSVVMASLYSVLLHKVKLNEKGSVFLFNLLSSIVWCICLLAANKATLHLDRNVLIWGVVYGITQALFILFKAKAMNEGAVSVTTLLGNCSLLISVFACRVIWGEPVSWVDIIGIAVLMLGIIFTTYKKTNEHFTKKWFIYAIFFLAFSAAVGIVFKAFSKSNNGNAGDMMIVAAVVMLISYSIICLINGDFRCKLPSLIKKPVNVFIVSALIAGLLSCVYNRLNIYLSGELIGAVFFPSFNGGVVVLSTVLGVVLLREKLSVMQIFGMILGVAGICIIGIF